MFVFSELDWDIAASKTFQNCEEIQKKSFILCRLGYSRLKKNWDDWPLPKEQHLSGWLIGTCLDSWSRLVYSRLQKIRDDWPPPRTTLSVWLTGDCPDWRSRLGKPLQLRALTFMDPCVPSFQELDRRWNIHKTRPFIQAQMFAGRKRRFVVQEW